MVGLLKKSLYLLSALASLIYIAFYSANVSEIVARHMDTELIIPLVVAGFTLFTAMLIFFTSKKTALDKKIPKAELSGFFWLVLTKKMPFNFICWH